MQRERPPLRPAGHKGGPARRHVDARRWPCHDAGRLRVTELRASDYFGPGHDAAHELPQRHRHRRGARRAGTPIVRSAGRTRPHSWTYVPDVGALAARLATDDRGWGRAWHVPTSPARTLHRGRGRRRPTRRRAAPAGAHAAPAARHGRRRGRALHAGAARDPSPVRAAVRPRLHAARSRPSGSAPTPWEDALEATIAARRTHDSRIGQALRPARTRPAAYAGRAATAGQCDCWRIRLVSSVTWL